MNDFNKNTNENNKAVTPLSTGNEGTQNVNNHGYSENNVQGTPNTQYTTPHSPEYTPYNANYYGNYRQPLNQPERTYLEEASSTPLAYEPPQATFTEVTPPDYQTYSSGGNGGKNGGKGKTTKKRQGGKGTMFVAMALMTLVAGGVGGAGTYAVMTANTSKNVSTTTTQAGVQTVTNTGTTEQTTGSVSTVAAKVSSSVVEITTTITATGQGVFGQIVEDTSEGAGSGVVITSDGYIATNNHVVDGANSVKVRLTDGTEYDAEVVGVDSQTDLAVLKINATGLNAAAFGNSDTLIVGEEVVAIGNPLGTLGGTVTNGIVSATNRSITIDNETMELIQTTAAINPGNSGGGLFNSSGELVGIVNAKSSGTGIEGLGFAIPANEVKTVVEEIMSNGYVTGRVKMGLSLVEVADTQTAMMYRLDKLGVYVAENNGEAQSGDLIQKVDGQEVASIAEIKSIIENKSVGDKITLTVLRSGQEKTITITLQEQTPTSSSTNK